MESPKNIKIPKKQRKPKSKPKPKPKQKSKPIKYIVENDTEYNDYKEYVKNEEKTTFVKEVIKFISTYATIILFILVAIMTGYVIYLKKTSANSGEFTQLKHENKSWQIAYKNIHKKLRYLELKSMSDDKKIEKLMKRIPQNKTELSDIDDVSDTETSKKPPDRLSELKNFAEINSEEHK